MTATFSGERALVTLKCIIKKHCNAYTQKMPRNDCYLLRSKVANFNFTICKSIAAIYMIFPLFCVLNFGHNILQNITCICSQWPCDDDDTDDDDDDDDADDDY